MARSALLVVGWLWPLLVAVGAVAAMGLVGDLSDRTLHLLVVVCYVGGTPAVSWSVFRWLPGGWPAEARWGAAAVLALAVVTGELFLSLFIYVFGLYHWDYLPA